MNNADIRRCLLKTLRLHLCFFREHFQSGLVPAESCTVLTHKIVWFILFFSFVEDRPPFIQQLLGNSASRFSVCRQSFIVPIVLISFFNESLLPVIVVFHKAL